MAIPVPFPDALDEAGPSNHSARYEVSETLSAHSRAVTALRFSNDGTTLVSAGADGWLHMWNPESGEHIRGLKCHKTGINDISISPDSLYIATASDDSTSLIHHLHPPPPPAPSHPSSHPEPETNDTAQPTSLTSSLSSSSSSSASSAAPKPLRVLASHTAPILSLAFSPKSNLLVTGSFDESAIIWDVRRGKPLRVLPAHADAIWSVGWDGEGGMVITASADGLIRLWDANSGQCLKTIDNDTNSPVSFASFTPSSYFLLSATLSSTLRVYNIHTSKVLKTFRAPGVYTSEKYPCPAIVFAAPRGSDSGGNSSSDANLNASDDDNVSRQPDKRDGEKMDVDIDMDDNGQDAKRESDSDAIANGNGNGNGTGIGIGNQVKVTDDQMQFDGENKLKPSTSASASPSTSTSISKKENNGRKAAEAREAWIVTGSENGKLVIFELQTKRIVQVLQGVQEHKNAVVAVAVHPDGKTIASGSLEPEKAIKLWRAQD